VHQTIVDNALFHPGQRVAIAASGGKGNTHRRKQRSTLLVPRLSSCCCCFLDPPSPDSTVLAHMMTLLNKRHGYGLDLFLLSIDEGITGYRDDSLEVRWSVFLCTLGPVSFDMRVSTVQTVKRNKAQYEIPLKIVSYEQLYGWTMDKIVKQIGMKNNCASAPGHATPGLDGAGLSFLC